MNRHSIDSVNASSQRQPVRLPLWRRRLNLLCLCTSVAGVFAASAISAPMLSRPRGALQPEPQPMRVADVDALLRKLQLTAEALAAAGLSDAEVRGLVDRGRSELAATINELRAAERALASARVEKERVERRVLAGLASREEATSLGTLRDTFAAAQAALDNQHALVLDAAIGDGVGVEQQSLLSTMRANSKWDVPVAYLCRSDATEAEWVALREALANERIGLAHGEEVSETSQRTLGAWRSNGAVAAALLNTQSRLGAVRAVWQQAIRDE